MSEYIQSLKTDLYELTMAAGYFQNDVDLTATFEMYCHTMPESRSFLVAGGLEQVIDYILTVRFTEEDVAFVRQLPAFKRVTPKFFDYLRNFKFSGNVWALPEGEIFFACEPILQIEAPIIEAQLLETYLLSLINVETSVASKAARIVMAARQDGKERSVVDFGSRRAHGPQAGVLAARAAYIGGCAGTSNVFASKNFGIPSFGTMAHSWIQTFGDESQAFKKYLSVFPETTTLLIDTYDPLAGAYNAAKLGTAVKAVRIDSGNLVFLSRKVRTILDERNLKDVKIIVSGNLDEYKIARLVKEGAPIDIFGVGTEMVVSRDYPALDLTYKLVQMASPAGKLEYKAKFSQGKQTIPGRKQIYRQFDRDGRIAKDLICLGSEKIPANSRPLLKQIIRHGQRCEPLPSASQIRAQLRNNLLTLPANFHSLTKTACCPITYSPALWKLVKKLTPKPKRNR